MDHIASAVLSALGGRNNVLTNTVCMTRLRITLRDPRMVDFESLSSVPNVLGTATRGANGLEVVFGPRVIDGIYHAFLRLTGIAAGTDALFPMSRQESNFRVKISQSKTARKDCSDWKSEHMDEGDISTLKNLFTDEEDDKNDDATAHDQSIAECLKKNVRLLVVNGPNVNMLGLGTLQGDEVDDYSAILELCKSTAEEEGFSKCVCLQSNHEGDLVDWIQEAWGSYDAIVINPSTYGPTSATLLEAIRGVGIPTAQVGLFLEDGPTLLDSECAITIRGDGPQGYAQAIRKLAELCFD